MCAVSDGWPASTDARVPLVVGITGHRDIRAEDREELRRRVRGILLKLRKDYPATPLILLSALAEGADRLAARAALDGEVDARLIVPLPMAQAIYEEDFTSRGSLDEFRELLGQAHHSFVIPLAPGNTENNIRTQGENRDRQYEAVGKYIARQSQILIALWDGVDRGLVGGTASIVRFKTEGMVEPQPHPHRSLLEPAECGPVYHVVTPRVRNPTPERRPFGLNHLYPKAHRDRGEAERYFHKLFTNMDEFNQEAIEAGAGFAGMVAQSKAYVIPPAMEGLLPPNLRATLGHYGLADALAIRFQGATVGTMKGLHALVFFGVVCFAIFAHYRAPWFMIPSLFMVIIAGLVYGRARRKNYQDKYQDYRALAEGLRVKLFWRLAGILDEVTDHYLGKSRTELDWIRHALRGWSLGERDEGGEGPHPDSPGTMDAMNLVLTHWVHDQQRYFARAGRKAHQRLDGLERWVAGSLILAGLLTILATILVFAAPSIAHVREDGARALGGEEGGLIPGIIVAISTCLLAAGLIHHLGEQMAFSEHSKQYARMQRLFAHASGLITQAMAVRDLKRAQAVVRDLGREALAENGDWVLLHRERPLSVPHAS
jgi:hypothetical protein